MNSYLPKLVFSASGLLFLAVLLSAFYAPVRAAGCKLSVHNGIFLGLHGDCTGTCTTFPSGEASCDAGSRIVGGNDEYYCLCGEDEAENMECESKVQILDVDEYMTFCRDGTCTAGCTANNNGGVPLASDASIDACTCPSI